MTEPMSFFANRTPLLTGWESAANNWTATSHLSYPKKAPYVVRPLGMNGWVIWCQENSYSSFSEWLEKAGRTSSHLLAGHNHNKERPTISQPQCGRCHRASSGQTTLEIIGSKWSYALNWYKLNNDDDDGDGDDDGNDDDLQGNLNSSGLQFELAYWLVGKEIYTR